MNKNLAKKDKYEGACKKLEEKFLENCRKRAQDPVFQAENRRLVLEAWGEEL